MSLLEAAHFEATHTPFTDIAALLQTALGQRLVAYATNTRSPQAIGRWARGENEPREDAERRARALFRVYRVLSETEADRTIRAWLMGSNPELDDQAPIEVLRAGDAGSDGAVVGAAEAFTR